MLSVRNLVKTYKTKKADTVTALNNVSIDFPETGLVFLLGKSGSGKSTLLNAIGGLDTFDSGEIIIKGKSSKDFSQSDFDSYRNTFIGFIFQEYNILENFTVHKNLALALELQGKHADNAEISRLLEQVEMTQYAKRKPNQLSGGQKQRVAIARALVKNPEIIMADEPTGALDSNTGKQVMDTLKELSKTKLVIIVSHDREFAEIYGDRIIELKDGKILQDITKKEIEARETASGIKVIDDNILYIRKGHQMTEGDIKALTRVITENAKNNDTFISFDKEANDKLKEGAKINDSGNKEAFLNTEKEDIKVRQYNPNSLTLIKSRLKFIDSFKMGASALKNKVGKLIFTILLSFFAFTVFGIVDALSCWNRADSVYQAMQMTEQTHIAMRKGVKKGSWVDNQATLFSDLEKLQEEFPNHTIKGVVKGNSYQPNITIKDISLKNNNNPLYQAIVGGYVSITEEEVTNMGLNLDGRLPANADEVCISKHLFDVFVKRTEEYEGENKITSFSQFDDENPLMINIDGFSSDYYGYVRVVGVIEDKTNLDAYKNKTDEELMEEGYSINEELSYSWSRLVYVTQAKWEYFANQGSSINYAMDFGQGRNKGYYSFSGNTYYEINKYMYDHGHYNESNFIENYGIVMKSGKTLSNLAADEIIVAGYYLTEIYSDLEEALEEGITLKLKYDISDESAVKEFKVVGYHTNGGACFVSSEAEEEMIPIFAGCEFMISALIDDEAENKRFITRLETLDDNNVKFSIQNTTTAMLDMLEDILYMMTDVFFYVAIGFAVFAALMLMNFISTSISYKKREIGVLRALGARGSDIFGIFFNESMIIATINFVLAAIATFVGCYFINASILAKLQLDIVLLNVSIRQLVLILAVSVGSAFVGSFLPTFKISRKKPIDAINNR